VEEPWIGRRHDPPPSTVGHLDALGSRAPLLRRPFRSRQAAHCALRTGRGSKLAEFGWCRCKSLCPPTPNHTHANPESWLQSHLLGPSLQNAPRHPSHLFLLFVDTHFLPPSSKHCLLRFSYSSPPFLCAKILHLLHHCPHLRVGQEEKDASQESRQGGEGPSRPPGQQPQERYRE
jgi:hypothetical protein